MKGFFKKLVQKVWLEKKKKDKIDTNGNNVNVPNLIEISEALDELYCLEKLQLYCNALSREGIVPTGKVGYESKSIRLITVILNLLDENDFNNPAIKIYLKIRQLFEKEIHKELTLEEDLLLTETEQLISLYNSTFEAEELTQIYSYLTNYVIKKINQGQASYDSKIIQLYNDLLQLRYGTIKRNKLPLHTNVYRNMVKISLRIEGHSLFKSLKTYGIKPDDSSLGFRSKEKWIEKFVDYYKNKLPSKDQDKYYRYCKALFLFHQKEFIPAYKTIGNPSYIRGLYINLDIKILYLQIIYEINDQEVNSKFWRENKINIPKVLDAYRDILKREKSEDSKLAYQITYFDTFLKLFRLLYHFHWNYDMVYVHGDPMFKKRKNEIIKAINSCSFAYKNWFENKFNQMIK